MKSKSRILPTVRHFNHSVESVLGVAQINAGRIKVDLRTENLAVLANKHIPIHRAVEQFEGGEQILANARVRAAQVVGQLLGRLDDRLLDVDEGRGDDEGADAVPLCARDLRVARVKGFAGGGN